MKSKKLLEVVRHIYDYVETALWALLIAFVIFFIVFVVPRLSENAARMQEIAAEKKSIAQSSAWSAVLKGLVSVCLFLVTFGQRSKNVSKTSSPFNLYFHCTKSKAGGGGAATNN